MGVLVDKVRLNAQQMWPGEKAGTYSVQIGHDAEVSLWKSC